MVHTGYPPGQDRLQEMLRPLLSMSRGGMVVVDSGSEKRDSGNSPSWGAPSCTGLQLQGSQAAVAAHWGCQTHKQAIIIKRDKCENRSLHQALWEHRGNGLLIQLYMPPPRSKNDLKGPTKLNTEKLHENDNE